MTRAPRSSLPFVAASAAAVLIVMAATYRSGQVDRSSRDRHADQEREIADNRAAIADLRRRVAAVESTTAPAQP